MDKNRIIIGITQGDINGISLEIILKYFSKVKSFDYIPVLYANINALVYQKKHFGMHKLRHKTISSVEEAKSGILNIIGIGGSEKTYFGKSIASAGKLSVECLRAMEKDLKAKKLSAVVTAPISKKNTYSEEFPYNGHTPFFKAMYPNTEGIMTMVHEELKVGLVTDHIAVKDISQHLTKENIVNKATAFHNALKIDFGIPMPKIAVLGLNPHAGEDGLLGEEENGIIQPAIQQLKENNILAFGPYASDSFFGAEMYKAFDGVLAMYHDQGLLPIKTLCFDEAVNYTAGLECIRVSPDHGVAYNIAGKNTASYFSLYKSIHTALSIYHNRKDFGYR